MTLDKDTLRPRRAVLAAALGGVAATVATALTRPEAALAGGDGDLVLMAQNKTTNTTSLECTDERAPSTLRVIGLQTALEGAGATGVYGEGTGVGVVGTSAGIGVSGTSTTGTGVSGSSGSGIALLAYSNATDRPAGRSWSAGDSTGLQGHSGADSPTAAPAKTGVFGYAVQDAAASGVRGQSAAGRGVYGQATTGQGVRGYATTGSALYGSTSSPKSGIALRTVGRVRFEQSVGIATVAKGSNHVTVTPGIDVNTSSAVVATLQGSAGSKTTVHRVSVSTTADTFTIYLTANATASVKVAWHIFG